MTVHILGGGTFSHVRNHLALAAPAFGVTARSIYTLYTTRTTDQETLEIASDAKLHLTKMADFYSNIVTNDDVEALIDDLIADPNTRVIYMNMALCDFHGQIGSVPSGKYAERLQSRVDDYVMNLTMADKLIGKIRKTRKDIFVVGFKTTAGATSDEQYLRALDMLKANSINLVVANDTVTRNNMIVAPEETRYHETLSRTHVLRSLVEMVKARSQNTFTRSTVVDGQLHDFQSSPAIPDNLRKVVNYMVERGAYKKFRGATAGHFAVKIDDGKCLTSRRKTDYTAPGGLDLVEVEYDGRDKVVAHGAKPSVGGQSQRIVFDEHPDMDCIVHAHIPMRHDARDMVPVAEQWSKECGSHQCGENTSRNLRDFGDVKAVMLDRHGPNIVFSRRTPPEKVIAFIEANFLIEEKTGGMVS